MVNRLRFLLFTAAALLASCGSEQPRAPATLLSGIPVMPSATAISSSAGADAVQAAYHTEAPPDSVAAWYRRWLLKDGWRITGDARAPGGVITLHGEKSGRPVWLMIQSDPTGTAFSIVGAEAGKGN